MTEADAIWHYEIQKSWDFENGFYLTSHPSRLAKTIAQWELYKKILHLPGDIVECGVYKGASLIRFATYREMTEPYYSRKIIGFDIFGVFPRSTLGEDNTFIEGFENDGGDGIAQGDLEKSFAHKHFQNYEFIQGDICTTVPEYAARHKEWKIALLHIDVDVYSPTKIILETLFDHIVPGGLIVLDDYGTVYGETKAVDEYLSLGGNKYKIEKLPYYKCPAFIVKT